MLGWRSYWWRVMAWELNPGSRDRMSGQKGDFQDVLSHSAVHFPTYCTFHRPSLKEWTLVRMGAVQMQGLGGTSWRWTCHRSLCYPGCDSAHSTETKTFASILTFTSITHFPTFGTISNIKYLDGKWGEGRGWGSHKQARHKQRLWICKRPIHQKSECLIFRNGERQKCFWYFHYKGYAKSQFWKGNRLTIKQKKAI